MRFDYRSVVEAKYNAVDTSLANKIRHKGQAAQFCWNGDIMVTHTACPMWGVWLGTNEVFQHHRIRFTFLPDQRLHFCHLLPSSSTCFFKTCTGNTHWQYAPAWLEANIFRRGQSAQVEMEGFAAFITQDIACGRRIVLLWLSCFHDQGRSFQKETEIKIQLIAQPYAHPFNLVSITLSLSFFGSSIS